MTARLLAFVVWATVAASAVFWGLRLLVKAPEAPPNAVAVGAPTLAQGDLTRLLGSEPVVGEEPALAPGSDRFKLVGVVAPKPGAPQRVGVALIAVDEKPARPFRIGASVDGRLVVQSVQPRSVSLGPRGAPPEVQLELPAQPPPATAQLPPPPDVARPDESEESEVNERRARPPNLASPQAR